MIETSYNREDKVIDIKVILSGEKSEPNALDYKKIAQVPQGII